MANTTYRAACERVLRLLGRNPFASNTEFDSGNIDSEKAALKEFFSIANQRIGRLHRPRFLLREFSLTLADGDNDYDIDTSTNVERLVPDSFYITTANEGGPITFYPGGYLGWKKDFPEGDETEDKPRFWFHLPSTSSNANHIGFSPPPDATYAVKYSAYLKPTMLTSATQEILWPAEYEDGLILAAASYLTILQAEGKHPDFDKLLDPLLSEIAQHTVGPLDDVQTFNVGVEIDPYGM